MPTDVPADSDDVATGPTAQEARLLEAWNAVLPRQQELGENLLRRYAEPQRRYHDLDHLEFVLDRIDEFKVASNDLFLVRLAAWFHDAVYAIPTRELTNEEASARLTVSSLIDAGLDQEDINEVTRMVRLTANHRPPPGDPNGSLLCDADLAILAAPPEQYRAYAVAVRAEYAHIPTRDFLEGRLSILEDLADSDIFRTTKGRRLTADAHENVLAECEQLAAELASLDEGTNR